MAAPERQLELLTMWLQRQLPVVARGWLDAQLDKLRKDPSEKALHIFLGMAPRKIGRDDLALSEQDLAAAQDVRTGWDPTGWTVDQTARILALCQTGLIGSAFAALFADLCRTAEVQEAIAFYRGLPLYPDPELLELQAAEGLRTNVRAIFEAVAHRNPYPREVFNEDRWNQMVLKALFIGSTLDPIQGLDERANAILARILRDFAHERWAAGRQIAPELWRCVGPFSDGETLADFERLMESDSDSDREAAALALAASPAPDARQYLIRMPELALAVESGALTWQNLSDGATA